MGAEIILKLWLCAALTELLCVAERAGLESPRELFVRFFSGSGDKPVGGTTSPNAHSSPEAIRSWCLLK